MFIRSENVLIDRTVADFENLLFTMNGRQKNKSYSVQLNYNLTKRTQHIDISNDGL